MLRLVNDQNDGWNAFTVSVFDDNTYEKEDFAASAAGDCSVANDTVYFNSGELKSRTIVFTKDSTGCVNTPKLITSTHTTAMRVVFDSLFCAGKMFRP